jgi:hypothetical protein
MKPQKINLVYNSCFVSYEARSEKTSYAVCMEMLDLFRTNLFSRSTFPYKFQTFPASKFLLLCKFLSEFEETEYSVYGILAEFVHFTQVTQVGPW